MSTEASIVPAAPTQAAGLPAQFPLETRDFNTEDGPKSFNVLVIDKPEKWEPATDFTGKFYLQFLGTSNSLEFLLRGISYGEWDNMELTYTYPAEPTDKSQQDAYITEFKRIKRLREVVLLELSSGKQIPGSTIQDKADWINANIGTGEVEALFDFISENLSCNQQGGKVTEYDACNQLVDATVLKFTDFNDWMTASQIGSKFRFHRSFQNYIIEFPLKQITQTARQAIENECKEPPVPTRPGKNPVTKQIDPEFFIPNYNDPNYQRTIKLINRKRIVMELEAVLPFKIPGTSIEEKHAWVGKRSIGDVVALHTFITREIFNYRSRVNFI